MTYAEKLKDPRWQKRRLRILERDDFTCQFCFDSESTLHVHHLWYENGDPWDTSDDSLITLCEECHEMETRSRKEADESLLEACRRLGVSTWHIGELARAIRSLDHPNDWEWSAVCLGISTPELREINKDYLAAKFQKCKKSNG